MPSLHNEFDDIILSASHPLKPTVGSVHLGNQKGWVCPKCGGVMSPIHPTCFFCRPTQESTDTGGPSCLME